MVYNSRIDAGILLAQELKEYKNEDAVVLALPRGGVVIAEEVAKRLNLPLGVVLVKKISHPSFPEYAIGAIAEDEDPIYSRNDIKYIDQDWLKNEEKRAKKELENRHSLYFSGSFLQPNIKNKTVIIVDDGMATSLTMEAAIGSALKYDPKQVIVAVPAASSESVEHIEKIADRVLVLDDPSDFLSVVSKHYRDFDQVDDQEVLNLLGGTI